MSQRALDGPCGEHAVAELRDGHRRRRQFEVVRQTPLHLAAQPDAMRLLGIDNPIGVAILHVMFQLSFSADPTLQRLPVVQKVFQLAFSTNYNAAFASYLMAMAPTIIVYIIAQR